jgi:4'-phosphopantetheinyl transferase
MPSPLITENEIHVWVQRYKLINEDTLLLFKNILSLEEREKLRAKPTNDLKEKFIIGKGSLRYLLQYYSDIPAQYIRFNIGPYGKPSMKHPSELKFNISHSGEMWILGLTKNTEIGIDIELVQNSFSYSLILDMVLSENEKKFFSLLYKKEKDKTFFDIWTKKEALLKAIGVGLSTPMTAIEIFGQETGAKTSNFFFKDRKFKLTNIALSSRYSTNLATEGDLNNIKIFQFNDLIL